MRFLKQSVVDYKAIAGEIINIEASKLMYIDGEYNPMSAIDNKGYPCMTDHNIEYTIKSNCGYIFVPPVIAYSEFVNNLQIELARMETAIPVEFSLYKIEKSTSTCMKLKQCVNNQRLFKTSPDMKSTSRFVWVVIYHKENIFNRDIHLNPKEYFWCSIFVDPYDIVKNTTHNQISFEIKELELDVSDKKIISNCFNIFTNGNVFEDLSNRYTRDALDSKIYDFTVYDTVEPIIGECVTDRNCYNCNKLIYDKNYILCNELNNIDKYVPVVCRLCAGLINPALILQKYKYVIIATFELSYTFAGHHLYDEGKSISRTNLICEKFPIYVTPNFVILINNSGKTIKYTNLRKNKIFEARSIMELNQSNMERLEKCNIPNITID